MTRHLFALDLDQTVVEWHTDPQTGARYWTISPAVEAAIARIFAAGHDVAVVTGRSLDAITDVLARLNIAHGYAVCSNGAMIVELDRDLPGGLRVLQTTGFDPTRIVDELRARFPDTRLGYITEHGVTSPDDYVPMWAAPLQRVEMSEEILNIFCRVVTEDPAPMVEIAARDGHTVYWDDMGGFSWMDIVAPGVSKRSGLEWIAAQLGIPQRDTIAIGDGVNDVDMLAWAGLGIAMGNASDRVKAVSDEVTAAVSEDGLALAVNAILDREARR